MPLCQSAGMTSDSQTRVKSSRSAAGILGPPVPASQAIYRTLQGLGPAWATLRPPPPLLGWGAHIGERRRDCMPGFLFQFRTGSRRGTVQEARKVTPPAFRLSGLVRYQFTVFSSELGEDPRTVSSQSPEVSKCAVVVIPRHQHLPLLTSLTTDLIYNNENAVASNMLPTCRCPNIVPQELANINLRTHWIGHKELPRYICIFISLFWY